MKSVNLIATELEKQSLQKKSQSLKSWDLTPTQVCDLELLLTGAFAPLSGFMTETEVSSVLESEDWHGHYWPAPIVLDVTEEFSSDIEPGESIALRDQEGVLVALMEVSSVFTLSQLNSSQDLNSVIVGGALKGLEVPTHHDFNHIRHTAKELYGRHQEQNQSNHIGYITRRLLHQREVNQINREVIEEKAHLLIAPATGLVKPEDTYHYAKTHAYESVMDQLADKEAELCLIPLYRREDPVVDVLLHAIVLKNSGCSHVLLDDQYIIDAAKSESLNADELIDKTNKNLIEKLQSSLKKMDLKWIAPQPMVYSLEKNDWVHESDIKKGESSEFLSDIEFQKRISQGQEIPSWFSYPAVVDQLKNIYRPKIEQGLTVFFTGLSGAGKSTIANALLVKLMEMGDRPITLLDGDIVRQHLSSELGFSKEHRDLNIRRIGYVASEITKHGGMAICAPIAPYKETRRLVRQMIEEVGGFVEVHVATSLDECERRDRKGLYAKARAGIIKEFTGISDPYEEPENPELKLETEKTTPEEGAQEVLMTLERLGYINLSS